MRDKSRSPHRGPCPPACAPPAHLLEASPHGDEACGVAAHHGYEAWGAHHGAGDAWRGDVGFGAWVPVDPAVTPTSRTDGTSQTEGGHGRNATSQTDFVFVLTPDELRTRAWNKHLTRLPHPNPQAKPNEAKPSQIKPQAKPSQTKPNQASQTEPSQTKPSQTILPK